MNRFALSRWIRPSERRGARCDEAEVRRSSREVRHRPHRYWSR